MGNICRRTKVSTQLEVRVPYGTHPGMNLEYDFEGITYRVQIPHNANAGSVLLMEATPSGNQDNSIEWNIQRVMTAFEAEAQHVASQHRVNHQHVMQLMQIGYTSEVAALALKTHRNRVPEALAFLLDQEGDNPQADPHFEQRQNIRDLVQLGFDESQVSQALTNAAGDRDAALELLVSAIASPDHDLTQASNTSRNAEKLEDAIRKLEGLNPAFKNSRRWVIDIHEQKTNTFKWIRKGSSREIQITDDVFYRPDEKAFGLVEGWVRTFRNEKLEFCRASQGCTLYSKNGNSNLTGDKIRTMVRVRSQTFPEKKRWFDENVRSLRLPWESRVEFSVNRSNFLGTSFYNLMPRSSIEWRAPFNLSFVGEPALDAGGLTREWFSCLITEIFSERAKLFKFSQTDKLTYQIDVTTTVDLRMYRFVGLLLGKAILDGVVVGAHFTTPLLKIICGYPCTWHDMCNKDLEFYNSMQQLLECKDCIDDIGLDMTVSSSKPGGAVHELLPGGANIPLTSTNLYDFINLATKHKLLDEQRDRLEQLLGGLYDVVPEYLLAVFDPVELEYLLGGIPEIDLEDWRANTKVENNIELNSAKKQGDEVIKWFWSILEEKNDEQRAKILHFATGTSQVPIGGFQNLQGHLGKKHPFELRLVKHCGGVAGMFPRGHTCFNRIDIPLYPSRIKLKEGIEAVLNIDFQHTRFGME